MCGEGLILDGIIRMGVQMGVLRGSVVRCMTLNLNTPGSSRTGSSEFFRWSVLGHDISEPQPSAGE